MYSFKELLRVKKGDVSRLKKGEYINIVRSINSIFIKATYGYGIKNLFDLSIWEAPINQIDAEILNPESKYNSKTFDTTIIFETTHSILEKYNSSSSIETFTRNNMNDIKN